MYISSYNTYIDSSTSQRVQKNSDESSKKTSTLFKLNPNSETQVLNSSLDKLPINYISNYKALSTKQRLEETFQKTTSKSIFSTINKNNTAQTSYSENSRIFSLILKPKQTLDQTPKIDFSLNQEVQKGHEGIIREAMINTYCK